MEELDPRQTRRLKWLFAVFLCPLCGLGFLWSVGALSAAALGAAVLDHPFVALAALALAAMVVLYVVRRRRRACEDDCSPEAAP